MSWKELGGALENGQCYAKKLMMRCKYLEIIMDELEIVGGELENVEGELEIIDVEL